MFIPTTTQLDAHYAKGYTKPDFATLEKLYYDGLRHAYEGAVCHITYSGTWTVSHPAQLLSWPTEPHQTRPCFMTSTCSGYEKVGDPTDLYGQALLKGWRDGEALIVDHRREVAGDDWMDGVVIS